MAQKTAAGEYLSISIQAAKAAGQALTDAQAAAEAGDVPAAQAAAKRAEEESVIAEQAWEALEKYRKGIATEKTAKALTNRDAAADNARLAKDFVKTARRKAKEMAKESAVFDQMADISAERAEAEAAVKESGDAMRGLLMFPEETPAAEPVAPGEPFTRHPDDDPAFWEAVETPEAEPVEMPEPVLEGEIVEAAPVTGDGMPPALDLAALAIPDARASFAEINTEAVELDYVAEAQKSAEAAELHANSAKSFAEDGDTSGARVRASLATGAANRARNAARAAREDGLDGAEDAQGYADMAAEYRDAARQHVQDAEAAAARAPRPDPVVTEALAEIADDSPQAAPEAPEAAEDVPQAPEAVQDAQAAPEDVQARAEAVAEQSAVHADRLAAARELAGPAIGEQAALMLDPADLAGRLATVAQDAAAAALHWSGRGNAAAAAKYAAKAEAAARGATACAEESEPEAGAVAVQSRRAWAWAAAAAKAARKAAENAAG